MKCMVYRPFIHSFIMVCTQIHSFIHSFIKYLTYARSDLHTGDTMLLYNVKQIARSPFAWIYLLIVKYK